MQGLRCALASTIFPPVVNRSLEGAFGMVAGHLLHGSMNIGAHLEMRRFF